MVYISAKNGNAKVVGSRLSSGTVKLNLDDIVDGVV